MSMQLSIVGGCYGEECAFPRRQLFRGSAGRAAALISGLGVEVRLHTVLGNGLAKEFAGLADHFGYELIDTPSDADVWFRYRFPLGRPDRYPSGDIAVEQPIVVAENMLVFGMIEGRPATHADRVVYDPQDGSKSKPYAANGSTAKELAMVVSYSEGRVLTGQKEPEDIATALLDEHAARVAIVKCGPQGALVRTVSESFWVYPFPTKNVYKIGSGDVFSAGFAYGWICRSMSVKDAAWYASRLTAHYVETGSDRIDPSVAHDLGLEAKQRSKLVGAGNPRPVPKSSIYLAGPFFNVSQQWAIDEARSALQDMGFNVFSPIHDVGVGPAKDVAQADLKALDACSVVLAVLDGLDPGTLFEVGYARAKGIPVIAVAESADPSALTMFIGSDCYITNDFTTAIYVTCWTLMGDV